MVPFAGWSMPIQYKDSIMESTIWCRENGSLFDVSHMCGVSLKGKDATSFLEKIVVGDIASLADGTGTLSVITNEKGGAIDDTVITKVNSDHLYLVVNAGCREKDLNHIEGHMAEFKAKGGDVNWEIHDERSLLAFQGPKAAGILQGMTKSELNTMYFGQFRMIDLNGIPCWVTRTGYTGEDGFEISAPDERTLELTEAIMAGEGMRLCGLGARDSLRLEAGLCLYGNDLTQDITPLEAGLAWTIGKRRREAWDFLGGDVLKAQHAAGIKKRRVGLVIKGAPARSHAEIQTADGQTIGEVTSGGFSPNLKKNIAMGYVEKKFGKAGTELKVLVRGKLNDAVVTKMPFVQTTYFKG
ncbi:hypothetical protein CYMTET_24161 [Cymbomonas tetramitiformis]|uniref:Aminomethyltransferase n=1 Tax=Cymbomonas tetramitiformis TaxID=36881 RepID=A0AAE0FX98_9CHLO|nr:hypothetical protein CYMTET_24161 [Cymbomonas tetramitiformis]|eukprot:gene6637-7946_t